MGNRLSCCKSQTQSPYKQKDSCNILKSEIKYDETISSLQHISEREPGDACYDPSTNPTAGPLFVSRLTDLNKKNDIIFQLFADRPLKKSSSCSTIFLDDSTVSHPNLKNMLKCVSMAIFYHIHNRPSNVVVDIFDERIFPLEKNVSNTSNIVEPDFRSIYRFIRILFNSAQLSSECAIITLVYLERLLTYAEIDIIPSTWRRTVLAAILLASKVWDDQAVWNVDYCQILRDISIEDMNELERRFLELLQFNINVPSSVYAKYYFELRNLAEKNNLILSMELLTQVRAQKLEALSKCDKNIISLQKNLKKFSSLDSIPLQKSAAIIS